MIQTQISAILAFVNLYRALHCAPAVTWNTTLEKYADNWVSSMAAKNMFAHSKGPYGENLAGMSYNRYINDSLSYYKRSVDMWYGEYYQYDYKNPGFTMSTGHFTQLVWNSTKSIGASMATSKDKRWNYVVMEFYPPGNVISRFASNVAKRCINNMTSPPVSILQRLPPSPPLPSPKRSPPPSPKRSPPPSPKRSPPPSPKRSPPPAPKRSPPLQKPLRFL